MDISEAYVGQVPLANEDFNVPYLNIAIGLGKVIEAVFGSLNTSSALVAGLSVIPGTGLSVNVGPGQIYVPSPAINPALNGGYLGSLPASTVPPDSVSGTPYSGVTVLKQGLQLDSLGITLAAPASGTNYYLIYVTFVEQETDSNVLPYFSSANPNIPLNGPNNTNTPNTVLRQCLAQVSNIVSTTGTPAVPSGSFGLATIDVPSGAPVITTGMIAQYSGAGAPTFIQTVLNLMTLVGQYQTNANALRYSTYVDGLVGTPARMLSVMFADQISFPANMAGFHFSNGTNPVAVQSLAVAHNGVSIGTLAVSTGGVATWTTTAFTTAPGDTLIIAGPGTADAAWADVTILLLATLVALG